MAVGLEFGVLPECTCKGPPVKLLIDNGGGNRDDVAVVGDVIYIFGFSVSKSSGGKGGTKRRD